MNTLIKRLLVVSMSLGISLVTAPTTQIASSTQVDKLTDNIVTAVEEAAKVHAPQLDYGKMPLYFMENKGQMDNRVKFYEKGSGHATFFTKEGVYLSLSGSGGQDAEGLHPKSAIRNSQSAHLKLTPLGANKDPEIVAEGKQRGKVNYFIGKDPKVWRTDIPTYHAVVYKEVYPGIDMKFYGNNRQLEYDIVVEPGADPSKIRLAYEGIEGLKVTENGDLEIGLKDGKIVQKRPLVYQMVNGRRVEVEGKFKIHDSQFTASTYSFEVAAYDKNHPLIIDPTLIYSTYLGGSGYDVGYSIGVDGSGSAIVTGYTESTDFPVTNSIHPSLGGCCDAFVTKISPAGDSLIYSTYFGGSGYDAGTGIAVDAFGNAYVKGATDSTDLPITPGVFQSSNHGGLDAFVAKFDPNGNLIYSTYLGGSGDDGYDDAGIAIDDSGNAYVTGTTHSTDFPVTPNPYQPTNHGAGDAFVTKLDASGAHQLYSTYFGGSDGDRGWGIAADNMGNAYLTGEINSGTGTSSDFPVKPCPSYDPSCLAGGAYVAKFDTTKSGLDSLVYSTYLRGNSFTSSNPRNSIAADADGNAYVTGCTSATDFPTTQGAYSRSLKGGCDVFVTKVNPDGSSFFYSTLLGGSLYDDGWGIAVDASHNAYVSGFTWSPDFPVTPGGLSQTHNGGTYDAFVTKLDADGANLLYSTYLGGSGDDLSLGTAIDTAGKIYVTGQTSSPASYSSLSINSGGFITFFTGPGNGCCDVQVLPSFSPPNGLIAAFWGDLDPYFGGTIEYGTVGTSPNRIFIVEFNNIKHSNGAAAVTFQIKLFEGSNIIEIHCMSCSTDPGIETQGIENLNGTASFFVSGRNAAHFSLSNDAVRFSPVGTSTSYTVSSTTFGFTTFTGTPVSLEYQETSGPISLPFPFSFFGSSNFPTTPGAFDTSYNGGDDAFVAKIDPIGPDLIMTQVTPNSGTVSTTATLPVTNTVKNQGSASAGSFKIGFKLSPTASYDDPAAVAITTTRTVTSLAAGASNTATTTLSIPYTGTNRTPPGPYYVCAKADSATAVPELDETNNTMCSQNTVTVPPADLAMTAVSTTTTAVAPGKTLSLSNTVKNQGIFPAGSFTIAFHLSTDTTYGNGDDIAFTATRSVTSLAAGATSTASTTLTIPSSTPLGSYYICAMADSTNTVNEGSLENNNALCTASTVQVTLSDLIMTQVSPNAATAMKGGTLSVTNTVKNQGPVSTGTSFRIGFRLSVNTTFGDSDDVVITTIRSVSALAAGASSTATTSLSIPSSTPSGTYYVCAKADSAGTVAETDENNNTLCSDGAPIPQVTVP